MRTKTLNPNNKTFQKYLFSLHILLIKAKQTESWWRQQQIQGQWRCWSIFSVASVIAGRRATREAAPRLWQLIGGETSVREGSGDTARALRTTARGLSLLAGERSFSFPRQLWRAVTSTSDLTWSVSAPLFLFSGLQTHTGIGVSLWGWCASRGRSYSTVAAHAGCAVNTNQLPTERLECLLNLQPQHDRVEPEDWRFTFKIKDTVVVRTKPQPLCSDNCWMDFRFLVLLNCVYCCKTLLTTASCRALVLVWLHLILLWHTGCTNIGVKTQNQLHTHE